MSVTIALLTTSVAAPGQSEVARASWWDRTSEKIIASEFHRVRSDLPTDVTASTAQGINRLWESVDLGLGRLRPRTRGLQQGLLFSSQEDLSETMRSQFAIDASSAAFAFHSPLGQGIAVCTEDMPLPLAARGLIAAVGSEYLRLSCGADLPPAIQCGVMDFLARLDSKGGAGGIGEAGLEVVRHSLSDSAALSVRELLSMDRNAWKKAQSTDRVEPNCEQAASIIRFLMKPSAATSPLHFQRYLQFVAEGTPSPLAIAIVYGVRDDAGWMALDKEWRAFARTERASSIETLRERLGFLGEGVRALDRDGAVPIDFATLEGELRDQKFVWPQQWSAGFSQVRADSSNVFTPVEPAVDASRPAPVGRTARARFELALTDTPSHESGGKSPPSIHVVDLAQHGLKLTWFKTRQDAEAPWVWDIGRGN
ncbi:MAG: hypothetical protein EXS15_07370 [Phycisphaerales bacterium]|nr:hypothetical protein [Phycisphaerales bacterium]